MAGEHQGNEMANILVIGSVAWDEVVQLDGPLQSGGHNSGHWQGRRIGGGAANTALALARAGDRPLLVSAVGSDLEGECLSRELARFGIDCTRLDRGGPVTTRSLVLLAAAGERTVINLARAAVPVPAALGDLAADCWYVRSADPALTPLLARRVARGPVLAHLPPLTAGCRPAQVLVGSAADLPAQFLAEPFSAGRQIAGPALEWVVITEGAAGARAYGRNQHLREPAPVVTAVDGTGAGDVFAAGLAHALARSLSMQEALPLAVAWGSASVSYPGTVPPPDFSGFRVPPAGPAPPGPSG
jgi:sugar/nucleoside kinase (ribokinase family)